MVPLFCLMLSAYGLGTLGALLFGRGVVGRGLVTLGAAVGSGAGLTLGIAVLASGQSFTAGVPGFIPLTGLALRLDGLGAFFLIVVGVVGVSAALYGFGYTTAYEGRYSLRMVGAMLNILLPPVSGRYPRPWWQWGCL
jgi:formate hydrogenlyase subunit 3/multisubunit Na+/H+ antiporter MnhD subunit